MDFVRKNEGHVYLEGHPVIVFLNRQDGRTTQKVHFDSVLGRVCDGKKVQTKDFQAVLED